MNYFKPLNYVLNANNLTKIIFKISRCLQLAYSFDLLKLFYLCTYALQKYYLIIYL